MLVSGQPPDILVKRPPRKGLYGWTPAGPKDEIWLHPALVNAVESLMGERPDKKEQAFRSLAVIPRVRLLVEAVVLHELVHFGRKILNGYNPDVDAEERIAQAFEIKAYGQVQTATILGIRKWVPDPD
jgi:hypothetical protein